VDPIEDPRYAILETLSCAEGRLTARARDRLTGAVRILKAVPRDEALHEALALLHAPPGVGPRLVDLVVPTGGARAWLLMEEIRGRLLADCCAQLAPEQLPALFRTLCQQLAHLHRVELLHMDLKASNVLISDTNGSCDVRLIDFGFARGLAGDIGEVRAPLGGTPGLIAPEVAAGWRYDGRADQFTLGAMWGRSFPRLLSDGRWGPLLERMTARAERERFPHMAALRDEVTRRFALPPLPDPQPPFGGGPLRGRASELAALRDWAASDAVAPLLLQAPSGTGLTRFLLEGLVAVARVRGAARMAEWGTSAVTAAGPRFLAFLEERLGVGEPLLIGIADPSPGWHALPPELAQGLKRRLPAGARRLLLLPLGEGALTEILAQSLGSGGVPAEEAGRSLERVSAGDLRAAAESFRTEVGPTIREDGSSWVIESESPSRTLTLRPLPRTGFSPDEEPQPIQQALALAARIGFVLDRALADGLLARFAGDDALAILLDRGLLQPLAGNDGASATRLRFLTTHLHHVSAARELACEAEVYAWLSRHARPHPGELAAVLAAADWAARAGDEGRRRRWLAAAWTHAWAQRREEDLRAIARHVAGPDALVSTQTVRRTAAELSELLDVEWDEPRVRELLARALIAVRADIADPILEELVRTPHAHPEAAVQALIRLHERDNGRGQTAAARAHRQALAQLAARTSVVPGGLLDWLEATEAFAHSDLPLAQLCAERARPRLTESDPVLAALCQQLLAILAFYQDAERGREQMLAALELAPDDPLRSQIHQNLAIMASTRGRMRESAQHARRAMETFPARHSLAQTVAMRQRLASAWSYSGQAREALRLVRELLSLRTRPLEPRTRVLLLCTAGRCQWHLDSPRAALPWFARAWELAREQCDARSQLGPVGHILEAVFELRAWNLVRDYGDTLRIQAAPHEADPLAVAAQLQALRARADGDPERAAALLEERLDSGRRQVSLWSRARYLQVSGVLITECAQAAGHAPRLERATKLLTEAAEMLAPTDLDLLRTSIQLDLARALHAASDAQLAHAAIDRAAAMARGLGCPSLMASIVRQRLRWNLAAKEANEGEGADDGPS